MKTLAVIGKVVEATPIEGADFIHSLKVVCGKHGLWRGVSKKDIKVGDLVAVFFQDAVLPSDDPRFLFMASRHFRVSMCRFKGAPSECLIMPNDSGVDEIGADITEIYKVTKYEKQLPLGMGGDIIAPFPTDRCPVTDEVNFQQVPELVHKLAGNPFYISEKVDGTSCTAWVDDNGLHVCSRNYELAEFSKSNPEKTNIYWRMAREYSLDRLPKNIFLQFEIVGPGIQRNPMGLEHNEIRVFSGYDSVKRKYISVQNLICLCDLHKPTLPTVNIIVDFPLGLFRIPDVEGLQKLAEIKYKNGNWAEGIVIRGLECDWSFKVINLMYKDSR